jgi:hypothetical protein
MEGLLAGAGAEPVARQFAPIGAFCDRVFRRIPAVPGSVASIPSANLTPTLPARSAGDSLDVLG